MIHFTVYAKDTRICDADYIFEDVEKFMKLVPYLKRKIVGDWVIAVVEPPIKAVRQLVDDGSIPEYVALEVYLEKQTASQLMSERPSLFVQQKTAYEKFMDLVAGTKVLINPKAARELYMRVGVHKDKLPDYLLELSEKACAGEVTISMVRNTVVDERKVYASEVLMSFLVRDRWRWKKYNELVETLGLHYAYYALRKYAGRLLVDKNKYLRNENTEIRGIEKVDAFRINQAYVLFNTTKYTELDMCMHLLEDRELMRRIV